MTANQSKTKRPRAVFILPTDGDSVPDLHRPYPCSWYRVVFGPTARAADPVAAEAQDPLPK